MYRLILLTFLLVHQLATSQGALIADTIYVCPPCNGTCDTLEFNEPGKCTHCDMQLITKKSLLQETSESKKRIAFFIQDGIEILDFAGPMEIFSYAGYEIFTVSKTKDTLTSQGILKIIPDYHIGNAPEADILAFFGGNAAKASNDKDIIAWIKAQSDIEYYFSVCTGAFFLGEAGILKNIMATTFHAALDDLEEKYPSTKVIKDVRYVDNGKVITTAGISAGIDGALHLVAKTQGFNKAREVAYKIEYDKWTPGEGLLLDQQNPYKEFMDVKNLSEYVGLYEFRENQKIYINIEEKENSIYAIVNEVKYPLFYLAKDHFHNINGDNVTFIRNNNGQVLGYKTSNKEVLYSKLSN